MRIFDSEHWHEFRLGLGLFYSQRNNCILRAFTNQMGNFFKSKHFLFYILSMISIGCLNVNAQLIVSQQNAASLVQDVLVGSGVTVSNIQFTGTGQMIGSFNGTNSNIGLSSGIIMSTGRIQDAVGQNNSPSKGDDLFQGGYAPLENILGGGVQTKDAAVLRFNFFCESDQVQFKYVFASEEYPEYVGSEYNDVFAFFISGPGITGNQNIALIPGTNQPVAINNVNASSYSNYFINNGNGINSGGPTVQYDGFTRPILAQATVIPCQTYTITIAIADVKDGIYDSAVFLEAQSFTSPEVSIKQQPSYIDGSDVIYEECGYNRITLTRTGQNSLPLTVNLESAGSASYGVDYTAFPTSLIFAPGQNEISFDVYALADGITENGGETVSIIYRDTGCTGITVKKVDFIIFDPPPILQMDPGVTQLLKCPKQPVQLNASVSGGVAPYSFIWRTIGIGNPITAYPDSSTWYVVEATDQCGSVIIDSVFIDIPGYIPLRLPVTPDTLICKGDIAKIGGFSTGGKQPISYFWFDVVDTSPIRLVQPLQTTTYSLSVTDSCAITVKKDIKVTVREVHAVYNVQYLTNSKIQFIDLSYNDVYNWSWDFGDGSGFSIEQNPIYTFADTGSYPVELIVSDLNNCKDTIINPIKAFPPFAFYIPNAFTPDGDGINDSFSGVGEGFLTFEMFIYNRWGEEIFHTEDYSKKWGTGLRGVLDRIPIDVYTYKIILTLPTLESEQYIGRVTVIR
jgi:gliding motility-associated-like protein